jgi:hypothetical protein
MNIFTLSSEQLQSRSFGNRNEPTSSENVNIGGSRLQVVLLKNRCPQLYLHKFENCIYLYNVLVNLNTPEKH